ncbi:MAG: competence protein ComEC [Pseudonocardiales bacterium]|jgi:competence protein ComEC|nr:competence protein ComEC [Pseudonocardiales bacterium]
MSRHRPPDASGATPPDELDVRLALGALAGWAAAWWGLGHSARAGALAVAGLLAAVLATLLLLRYVDRLRLPHRPVAALRCLALLGCCAAAVLAPLSARVHQSANSALAHLAGARPEVTALVVVTSDPRPLAAHGAAGSPRAAVDARVIEVRVGSLTSRVDGSVLILAPADTWSRVLPGQRVRLDARLAPALPGNLLTATLSARTEPELVGAPPWWQRGAAAVRARLQRACASLPSQEAGLLPGLVDGDTSRLDPVLAERFRVAGLTHLVAVSGTNCSIVIGAVALVLGRFRASPRMIALIGGLVLVGFVVFARPSPSVLRAAVMAGIGLLALAFGRQRSAIPVLAAATLALLSWQPTLAMDYGFLLSVSATASLLLIAPGWAVALRRRRVPPVLAEALAVAAAAHLVTAPVIAAISGQFSLVAIPANMLAEPVVALTTILGVLAALLSVGCPPLAAVCAQLAGWPCRWLVWVAERFGAIAGATIGWPSGVLGALSMAGLGVVLVLLVRRLKSAVLVVLAVVCCLIVQIPVRILVTAWPPPGWLIVACDVGQGDALAVSVGAGAAVVIDTGPEPIAVDRCLRGLQIQRIPLLVLSHSHLDHVAGIAGVLHGRRVERAVTSPLTEPLSGYRLVRDALSQRGLGLGEVGAGESIEVGSGADAVHIAVIGPSHIFRGSRSDPNNSSVVLMVTTHGKRILLPGDAEVAAQDELLSSRIDLRADVLKVPHHGSAYSDPAFLQAVHAQIGLVSVGRDNDYGHPSALLIAAMARLGVQLHRTDREGDLAVVLDRGGVAVVVKPVRTNAARAPPTPKTDHRPPTTDDRRPPAAGRLVPSEHRATMMACHSPPASPHSPLSSATRNS